MHKRQSQHATNEHKSFLPSSVPSNNITNIKKLVTGKNQCLWHSNILDMKDNKRFENVNQDIRQVILKHFQKFISFFLLFLSNQILQLRAFKFWHFPEATSFFIIKDHKWKFVFPIINSSLLAVNTKKFWVLRGSNIWN